MFNGVNWVGDIHQEIANYIELILVLGIAAICLIKWSKKNEEDPIAHQKEPWNKSPPHWIQSNPSIEDAPEKTEAIDLIIKHLGDASGKAIEGLSSSTPLYPTFTPIEIIEAVENFEAEFSMTVLKLIVRFCRE